MKKPETCYISASRCIETLSLLLKHPSSKVRRNMCKTEGILVIS
jgi:hypothetical protein